VTFPEVFVENGHIGRRICHPLMMLVAMNMNWGVNVNATLVTM
jgi:hypothetical protein